MSPELAAALAGALLLLTDVLRQVWDRRERRRGHKRTRRRDRDVDA